MDDIEIAQNAKVKPIKEVAATIGLTEDDIEPYGKYIAKIPYDRLAKMGDKLEAKKIAVGCGVPVIPGTAEPLKDAAEAEAKAIEFGFPVILKAAAGGGGRGMRLCRRIEDVAPAFELVRGEARKAFGDDSIFMEKYLVEPKHIEVQILADEHGNVRHLGEREAADKIERALMALLAGGERVTRDIGGTLGTDEFAAAVIEEMSK